MNKKSGFIFLVWLMCFSIGMAQNTRYHSFDNIKLELGSAITTSILQDSLGLIWIGTGNGLYSYDGYSIHPHFLPNDFSNTQIHCGLVVEKDFLYLGTDNGLLVYNLRTDRYETPHLNSPTDIRTMVLQGDSLWLGSLNGLFLYRLSTKELVFFDPEKYDGLPHKTVYSMVQAPNNELYIGTYNGLCKYTPAFNLFQQVELPKNPRKSNQFINSLLLDNKRNCLWIGMEGNLIKFCSDNNSIVSIKEMQDKSVKSMCLDADNALLIGTDNGLYVYREGDEIQHTTHDARNPNSLINNSIWTIFTDKNKNIWMGTGSGISLIRNNLVLDFIPIYEITGRVDGNQFYSMFKDSRGYYWLGGTNGIIRVERENENWINPIWYNTSNSDHPLPHGRVRHIFESKSNNLWIATDGSINRYNYDTKQFTQYHLLDKTGNLNSNWAYNILEDNNDNLWIATCLGGLFVMNEDRLLDNSVTRLTADNNFNTENGLSGMFLNQVVLDKTGNIWVLLYNDSINIISTDSKKVRNLGADNFKGLQNPSYLLSDQEGFIWVGFNNGVLRIDPETEKSVAIPFETSPTNEVLSMMEIDHKIWISTTDGFWFVNQNTFQTSYLNLSEHRFLSMFYDKKAGQILLGDVDGIAITSPEALSAEKNRDPLLVTGIYINNIPFDKGTESNRYLHTLNLNYQQNNLAVEVSDLPYAQKVKNKLVYRMDGLDEQWNPLDSKTNRISYSNLSSGEYQLLITKLDATGNPSANQYGLNIIIHPPWYLSLLAKIIYILVVLSLTGWTINFFRVRQRLRMARLEKQKIMEQSQVKMEFLTNLSHELKTPLSMIIAPISRLLPTIKDAEKKRSLKQIQNNAIKLNVLIHQMLDFNRIDSSSESLLILSHIEFIGFARKMFNVFQAAANEQKFNFIFDTNIESLYLDIDRIKWEAILSNILSNAVKYSPEGGEIRLSIQQNEIKDSLKIEVSDTGLGIPAKDIPYVFQRFFQSSRTNKSDGTGIGLYLVKSYAEMHGGSVLAQSNENKGTTITINLPIKSVQTTEQSSTKETTVPLAVSHNHEKPLVLVVDDNKEIAAFIQSTLDDNYHCVLAKNGNEGLKMCDELKPDLIISDVMMPGMTGLEMVRNIRKNIPSSTLPIILLTAKDDAQTELESIQLNVDAFLPKPFDPIILLSRIQQLLNQKEKLEAKVRMENIATPKEPEVESQDEKLLASITHIIEEHMADADLNVAGLSKLSGIGNKQLYRKIKQLTGSTPVEYIRSVRMKKAAMLLRQQKFSVAEVMYMVGFSNHSYFSKCFKAAFDQTPLQYKETVNNPS